MKSFILRTNDYAIFDEESDCYKINIEEVNVNSENCSLDFSVEKVGDDFICLSGNVKWDGCINFKTETMQFHLCDPKEIEDVFGKIIKSVYYLASKYLSGVIYGIPRKDTINVREI